MLKFQVKWIFFSILALAVTLPVVSADTYEYKRYIRTQFEDEAAIVEELRVQSPEAVEIFLHANELFGGEIPIVRDYVIEAYDEVLALAPDFDVAIRRKGVATYKNRQSREGIALIEKAYGINPRPETAAWLAKYLLEEFIRLEEFPRRTPTPGTLERIVTLAFEAAESHPTDTTSLLVGYRAAARLEDTATRRRFLDLAYVACDAGQSDVELMRFFVEASQDLNEPEPARRVFDLTSDALEADPVNYLLLEERAKAAHLLKEWSALRRMKQFYEEKHPRSRSLRDVEKLLEDNPKAKVINGFKQTVTFIWEITWLRRILGGALALVCVLLIYFKIESALARLSHRKKLRIEQEESRQLPQSPPLPDVDECPQPAQELPKAAVSLEVIGVFIATIVLAPAFIGFSSALLFGGSVPKSSLLLLLIVGQTVIITFCGLLLRHFFCASRRRTQKSSVHGLMGLAFGASIIGASFVAGLILHLFAVSPQEQRWIVELMEENQVAFVFVQLLAVIAVPIAEEIFFRGYVFERLNAGVGRRTAYIVSTVLFAVSHFNLSATPVYLAQGFLLARAYDFKGSLTTPIIAHAINNLVVLGFLM